MDIIKRFLLKNTSTKQTVAKNTIWLFVGEIVSKISRAALIIIAARVLGTEGLGVFSYVMALGGMFLIFEDSGLSFFVTRELSTQDLDEKPQVATAMVLKLMLLTFAIVLFLVFGPFYVHSTEARMLIPIMAIVLFTDSLRGFLFSISRSQQKMEIESLITLTTSILVLTWSVLLLSFKATALMLTTGYAIGGTIGFLCIVFYARRFIKTISSSFNKKLLLPIIRLIWPYAIYVIANMVILNIDVFLLGNYASDTTVGVYSAAQRLIQMAYVVSSLIASATFPVFARKSSNENEYTQALEKVFAIIWIVLGGIVTVTVLWADKIIVLLFGSQYYAAGHILRIMTLGLIPIYISAIYFNVIFALNQQKRFVFVYCTGLIISIVTNLMLIPRYGGIGAAISSITTFAIMAALTAYIFNKHVGKINIMRYINTWFIAACIACAGICILLRSLHLTVLVGLPIAIAVYAGIIVLTHKKQLRHFYALSPENSSEQ